MFTQYPIILENSVKTASELELVLIFPKNFIFFRGHFDNFPILPGVIQLHYAIRFIKEYFPGDFFIKGFEKVKFLKMIFPDRIVFLKLNRIREDRFSFLFETKDRETCSLGEILLNYVDDHEAH
jgi:3-hydroxymyristoyl/3-hydroxydecanoyl-(acyl carrier protein) dehydratase